LQHIKFLKDNSKTPTSFKNETSNTPNAFDLETGKTIHIAKKGKNR
jgi:hypothetical protein